MSMYQQEVLKYLASNFKILVGKRNKKRRRTVTRVRTGKR